MNLEILDKFTSHLKNALADSVQIAMRDREPLIEPIHLFLSLAKQTGSIGAEILEKHGFDPSLDHQSGRQKNNDSDEIPLPEFSNPSKALIERAAYLSSRFHHNYIGTEHLLKGFLEMEDETEINRLLKHHRVNRANLNKQLDHILGNASKFPEINSLIDQNFPSEDSSQEIFFETDEGFPIEHQRNVSQNVNQTQQSKSQGSSLDFFCKDLTNPKIQESIDPVIGRSEEIDRVIHILSRRTKNNPILIGEPGVGKTAIAEGLAKRIVEKKVPSILLTKRVLSLDLSLVVAGTIYRGEFEGRFKQILEEIKNDPSIILFIDEIHNIVGAGGTMGGGTLDAANILKPALSKGDVRCIGATTLDEYKKYIEADAALERRFQPVFVEEPSVSEAVEILHGLKSRYEDHHHVRITDEAIQSAVDLSVRYLPDKHLPDKAIDLIDEASAKFRINHPSDVFTESHPRQHIPPFRPQVKHGAQPFFRATSIKTKTRFQTQKIIGEIGPREIIERVAKITKIPLHELKASDRSRLLKLEDSLSKEIIGQREVVSALSSFIRRSHAGLASTDRPLGSFLFLGPSGVGKTHTAKVLAKSVFQDEKALIRIDMSEFNESFHISKLIGSPAGYVGYRESTKLTDLVKRRPYSVVLFDEIEKAHPDVYNLLLQVLDEGHLTDATGRKINFKNTIIIMTSNIGLRELNKGASIGFLSNDSKKSQHARDEFNQAKKTVLDELHKTLPLEFLNRLDAIIVFKPLSLRDITAITERELSQLSNQMKSQRIALTASKEAIRFLAKEGYKPEQGARGLRRVIQDSVETPMAKQILSEKIPKGSRVHIAVQKKKLVIGRID